MRFVLNRKKRSIHRFGLFIFVYIDILAESVTFDTETKIPLSKEDLSKIDWYGENAGQGREYWFYTDVYEIYGTDKAEAVAVNVNDNYYIAKRQ